MLKTSKTIKLSAFCLIFAIFFTSCEFLQGSLSSDMEKSLNEETGTASYQYKTWYYNGKSDEDMTNVSSKSENDYYPETLKIDFTKKTALSSLSPAGKITVNYTTLENEEISKTITALDGRFSKDYKSFYLDMNCVTKLLDGKSVKNGTLTVGLKAGGFICAEGNQNGRPLETLEISSIQVKPLYSKNSFDYSTAGFSNAEFVIPLNGTVNLKNPELTVSGLDKDGKKYIFSVTASGSSIVLKPEFTDAPADGTVITLTIDGILPEGAGDSYKKTFSLKFNRNLIVIDGEKDTNWSDGQYTISETDTTGEAQTDSWTSDTDFSKISVTNDEDYLYIALEGNLKVEWDNGIALLINKDNKTTNVYEKAGSGKEGFGISETVNWGRSNRNGTPDFYLFDRIYKDTLKAWVNNIESSEADEASEGILHSSIKDGSFIEYAIPLETLRKAGIKAGEEIKIIGIFSAHWDEANYVSDSVPDAASNGKITSVNFNNGLKYTVK